MLWSISKYVYTYDASAVLSGLIKDTQYVVVLPVWPIIIIIIFFIHKFWKFSDVVWQSSFRPLRSNLLPNSVHCIYLSKYVCCRVLDGKKIRLRILAWNVMCFLLYLSFIICNEEDRVWKTWKYGSSDWAFIVPQLSPWPWLSPGRAPVEPH